VLRLSNWTGKDLKGQFVNKATTVNLNARVLCFETAGLENHPDLYEIEAALDELARDYPKGLQS
jgi:hypothetical protein